MKNTCKRSASCVRYFLNPDGTLCAVEAAGRCDRYWQLWGRREALIQELAAKPLEPRLSQLKEARADAELHLGAHLDVCEACRAWIEECRAVRFQAEPSEALPA